jgi:phosphatidylinositol alpha-mannosyltransferase
MTRPGGVQGQVLGLARELRRLGVDVRVLAPCDGPPPAPSVICVGPSVEWDSNGSIAPIAAGADAARRGSEALRSIEPHVVHLHEPGVPGPCLSTLIGFDGPMVGTFHASGDLAHQWARPAMRGLMARLTTRVAVSEAARDTALLNWGGDYEVLWNGIEIERFAGADPTPSELPAVFFIGRHEPRKGLEVLLDAWRDLDREAVLWIASSGPQTKALRKRNVAHVEWLGPIPDRELEQRMRGARVFCAPSLHGESFGVVLLEAMAAETPVVASAIDGYQNVARPDREALLVEPGNVEQLRDALQRVLDDAELRRRLVEHGRTRAAEFSMNRLAQRYLELYEKAQITWNAG